ncbi:hypothetical protein OAU52_00500 [bacterium]|nr:hypothetical protein [bacterium]
MKVITLKKNLLFTHLLLQLFTIALIGLSFILIIAKFWTILIISVVASVLIYSFAKSRQALLIYEDSKFKLIEYNNLKDANISFGKIRRWNADPGEVVELRLKINKGTYTVTHIGSKPLEYENYQQDMSELKYLLSKNEVYITGVRNN